jgi:hypothetical protein
MSADAKLTRIDFTSMVGNDELIQPSTVDAHGTKEGGAR